MQPIANHLNADGTPYEFNDYYERIDNEPHTLVSLIDGGASGGGHLTFAGPEEHVSIGWDELADDAKAMAAVLQRAGVSPGDHVSILGPTNRAVVTAVQAIWRAGGCVVMLPLPMRLASIDAFIEQTRRRIADAEAVLVLIDAEFAPFVEPAEGDPPFIRLDEAMPEGSGLSADDAASVEIDPDQLAILQFTSGSTADPKGVMLTHRAVWSNVLACASAGSLTRTDVVCSWLPLYHDMGMVGMLTIPMCHPDVSLVLGAPQDFLAKPLRWLEWISTYNGSVTAAPNFAYALATRALRKAPADLDLSSMKVLLSGAEPVDGDTFRKFLAKAGEFGLPAISAYPAFGMAEVCIGGTFPARGQGLRMELVDAVALEHDHVATPVASDAPNARELAILGRAVPGLTLRVVDRDTGATLGDRQVGELLISGSSLTSGYYRNPEATEQLIVNGWLHTGDLAYLVDGELVLCGRIKDVIIIGGRNIYPQDVERVVNSVEGIRVGNAIAFGIDGRAGAQSIVVVAESRVGGDAALVTAVSEAVTADVGVPPKAVVLVQPGTLPKTSSGKLQRSACRAAWQQESLALADSSP